MKEISLFADALVLLKHQNFSRAAKALNVSQPTLSRRIQLLETMFEERLFDRTSGKILPTQAGKIALKHARIMLASSKAMHEEIERHKGVMEGNLHIGAGTYPARALLAPAIGRFSERHPGIHIKISVDDWSKIADQLMEKDFDYVLMESSHLDVFKDYDLIRLNRHQAFFYCRRGHPLLEKTDLVISDLSQYPLIRTTLPKRLTDLFIRLFYPGTTTSTGFGGPQNIVCNDLGTMNSTVSRSNSIGIATFGSMASELEAGFLVALPFRIPELTTQYNIAKRKRLSLSPAARILIDILVEIDREQYTLESELVKSLGPVLTASDLPPRFDSFE